MAITFSSEVLMASGEDGPKDTDSPESPEDAEALNAMIMSVEEKITLCDVIHQDLLAVQNILKEKGLCDASLQAEKKE